jgi:hypothetical protein
MKCFETLVIPHVNIIIPDTLDPLQFTYCPNRSTDYEISTALHTALSHMEGTNVRMLFIDYSSVFNTIVLSKFITKLRNLGLNTSLCNWILDFQRGQVVRVCNNTPTNMRAPQGCVLSPLLYSLFTHVCIEVQTSTPLLSLLATQWW